MIVTNRALTDPATGRGLYDPATGRWLFDSVTATRIIRTRLVAGHSTSEGDTFYLWFGASGGLNLYPSGGVFSSQFKIFNDGNSPLNVSAVNLTSTPGFGDGVSVFSAPWTGAIAPGGSQIVPVTLTMTGKAYPPKKVFSGSITITSDATFNDVDNSDHFAVVAYNTYPWW